MLTQHKVRNGVQCFLCELLHLCMGKVIPSQLSYYEDQINQRLFDKREKILTNHYFFQGRDHIYLKETKVSKKLLSSPEIKGK